MRFEVVTITPALARELLDRAAEETKRSIRRNRVIAFAHAMRVGQWTVTHQPIAVGTDGVVFDGFHRLSAIIEADVPVDQLVAWDADPATHGKVDTGTTRTMADSLKIAGHNDTTTRAAAVRAFLTYNQVAGTTDEWRKAHAAVTTEDVLNYLDSEDGARIVEAARSTGMLVSQSLQRYGVRSGVTAVSIILRSRRSAIGLDTQAEFFERLADGVMLPAHSPILALRKWYLGAGSDEGFGRVPNRDRHSTLIAVTIKTINDYAAGWERSQIRWHPGRSPMPEPLTRRELNKIHRDYEARLEEIERRDEELAGAAANGGR